MEKTQAGSRQYPRNSERAQDDRTVKWRTVDGKLLLDPGKKGVYPYYALYGKAPKVYKSLRGSFASNNTKEAATRGGSP